MVRIGNKVDALESIYREEGLVGALNRCKNYVAPLPAAYLSRAVRRTSTSRDDRIFLSYIDPNEIGSLLTIAQNHFPVTGPNAVVGSVGGPWDRYTRPFRATEEYVSVKEYLIDGVPWEETPKGKRRVRQGRNEERLAKEANRIRELAENIQREGYRSQAELLEYGHQERIKRKHQVRSIEVADEIFVGLGRNDELIRLGSGRHRLAIAQLFDIDSIPAILILRHRKADVERSDVRPEYVMSAEEDEAEWRPMTR